MSKEEKNKLKKIVEKYPWTQWKLFPNPADYGFSLRLVFREILSKANSCSSGVYQVRDKNTDEWILFCEGGCLEIRMGSLLPQSAGGTGTRNNSDKREDIWQNINNREYRVLYTKTKVAMEQFLKNKSNKKYAFVIAGGVASNLSIRKNMNELAKQKE